MYVNPLKLFKNTIKCFFAFLFFHIFLNLILSDLENKILNTYLLKIKNDFDHRTHFRVKI